MKLTPAAGLCLVLAVACRGDRSHGISDPTAGDSGSAEIATGSGSTAADGTAGDGGGSDGGPPFDDAFDLPALVGVNDGSFATSPVCAECHGNAPGATAMRDESGSLVAPDDLWQGTMMANSARDPFWWAMVKAEAAVTPSRAAEIEAECTHCHAPMASIREDLYGGPFALADLLDGSTDRGQLGLDGVACAACHQIPTTDVLGPPPLPAVGEIYGPHAAPFTMPMAMHTGFVPTASSHMDESAVCGTCHTLTTEALAPDGAPLGRHVLEQAPYLEWRNSIYTTEGAAPGPEAASCQSCHMPSVSAAGVPISTRIARRPMGDDFPPISERSPFHRHVLVGGNTLVPAMLRDFAQELRPRASAAAFDATIAAARGLLEQSTASVSLAGATRDGDALVLPVEITSAVGHKLPSGIPARRAFVHVEVRDGGGKVVFRSGATDDQGRLVDRDGAVLASEILGGPLEPHRTEIDDDAQVQIYESVLGDADGAPVYRLLRGEGYAKDNRILPAGWSAQGPHAADTAPVLGRSDGDFAGGSDVVRYRVLAPATDGPYTVDVSLRYQPIGARFVHELLAIDAPEVRAFERIWDASDRGPETIASASIELP